MFESGMHMGLLFGAVIAVTAAIAGLFMRERCMGKKSVSIQEDGENAGKRDSEAGVKMGLPIDYDAYIMPKREKAVNIAAAAAVIFAAGYVFYRSFIISLCLTPFALLYPKRKTKEIVEKRKHELNMQFKEALYSLSSSLSAGKSVETAFAEALQDLTILYPGRNAFIIREFECIVRKLEMNVTIEAALQDLADRAHLEDITGFVGVFQICKRTGGNLVQVIKNSSDILRDKIEIKQEIDTLLAERKFEQKVLNGMPVFMIFFVSMSAGDFMQPVFSTFQGHIVMTLAVFLLAAAYGISKKIMDIEV